MNVWLVIFGMGLVTFASRAVFLVWMGREDVPAWLRRMLRFIPPSVLTVLAFMGVFLRQEVVNLSPLENERVIAAAAAGLVAWRTRQVLPTIVVGMVIFWVLQAIV